MVPYFSPFNRCLYDMMVLGNKRLWLGILLPSKLLWNVAIASTVRSHSKGDTDSREDASLSDEDGAAAVSRRIMRAEKTQESVEVPAAGLEKTETVPFDDVLFNVTVTQPPFAQSSESSQHAGEQQDCRWYDWSPWSYCSKSCGQGWKSRKRTVALQPRHGGLECDGASEDFDHCNEVDCPVDCGWGVWSDWSHCTASCDGGTRQRGKPIKVQNNSLGKPCNMAEGIQVEDCGTSPCPRDCTWADWTKWGECSTTCAGGVKLRSRSIAEAAIADGKKMRRSHSGRGGLQRQGVPNGLCACRLEQLESLFGDLWQRHKSARTQSLGQRGRWWPTVQ